MDGNADEKIGWVHFSIYGNRSNQKRSCANIEIKTIMAIRNRSGIHIGKDGVLTDKFGRTFTTDWNEFKRKRKQNRVTPALLALKLK